MVTDHSLFPKHTSLDKNADEVKKSSTYIREFSISNFGQVICCGLRFVVFSPISPGECWTSKIGYDRLLPDLYLFAVRNCFLILLDTKTS